ncbi:hypothetical protein D3C76_1599770 [compost metagenome]
MENGAVVVASLHVLLEVGHGFRGFVFEELQGDDAVVGVQLDHWAIRSIEKSKACQGIDSLGYDKRFDLAGLP